MCLRDDSDKIDTSNYDDTRHEGSDTLTDKAYNSTSRTYHENGTYTASGAAADWSGP